MAQAGQNVGFPLELAGVFLCEKQVFFYGNVNAEVFIRCTVNSAHPSLTKDGDDAVSMVEECTWGKRHLFRPMIRLNGSFYSSLEYSAIKREVG